MSPDLFTTDLFEELIEPWNSSVGDFPIVNDAVLLWSPDPFRWRPAAELLAMFWKVDLFRSLLVGSPIEEVEFDAFGIKPELVNTIELEFFGMINPSDAGFFFGMNLLLLDLCIPT